MYEFTSTIQGEKQYSERQAAARLGVSQMTVRRYRERGQIKYYKIGSRVLISERQLADFLTSCEVNKADKPES